MIASNQFTLRKYQREASDRSVKFLTSKSDKHGLLVLPTGSGKSLVIADIVEKLNAPTLVFQPSREILRQNFTKLMAYGFKPAVYSASLGRKQISLAVTLATIGSVIRNVEEFESVKYVLIDECFPAGTLVDGRPIESLKPGNLVTSFNHGTNSVELRPVVAISARRSRSPVVRITLDDGTVLVCTDRHPIYTCEQGYIPAAALTTQHSLIHYEQKEDLDLYGVRQGMPSEKSRPLADLLQFRVPEEKDLREATEDTHELYALQCATPNLRESADELPRDRTRILPGPEVRDHNADSGACSVRAKGSFQSGMATSCVLANEIEESDVAPSEHRQDGGRDEGKDLSRSRWERTAHQAAIDAAGSDRAADRVRNHDGCSQASVRVGPALLQGGSGRACNEAGDRGRREEPQAEEMAILGSAKDGNPRRIRVVSVEVYERADRPRPYWVSADDRVYNLEIEGNNNYFANRILVHNCHLVNAAAGMYAEFFQKLEASKLRILGLTATPYRLTSTMEGPILKFLTRTRPRVFSELVYYVQNGQLFTDGHLAKLEYFPIKGFDRSKLQANSTGADYTDKSVQLQFKQMGFAAKLQRIVERLIEIKRKGVLVFTRFLDESRAIVDSIPGAVMVSAETPDAERDRILKEFKAGTIKVVCNVGVLTTGFDYPELDTVVLARPTMSLALYYQMVGRAVRPHPNKINSMIVDMVGLLEQFGKVEDLRIVPGAKGMHYVASGGRQLTNCVFGQGRY